MKENQKLVTIARFEDAFEAEQAKAILEDEGIRAVLFGADLMTTMPPMSRVHIILQVFEEDKARAEQILSEQPSTPANDEEYVDEEGPEDTDE